MMKCSICKTEKAIIHIHEYSQSGVRKINLCLNCAVNRGLNLNGIKGFNKVFGKLINNVFNINTEKNKKQKRSNKNYKIGIVCPSCKTNIEKLTSEYKVGCETCYNVFSKIIDILVYKNNNSLNYFGKLPYDLKIMKNEKNTLNDLKNQLKYYVFKEEYNKAANVRDKIKELKKTIQKRIRKIANT